MSDLSATDVARRAFLAIDAATTLDAVDSLNLRANAKVSAVVGVPLRQLQQRRDVSQFATTAPILAVKGLLEVMAMAPLEKMIEALGEHADAPTFEQMAAATDVLLASGTSRDDVIAVLAHAISENFPAAPHCRRLFTERDDLALPALPAVVTASILASAKVVSPEIRAQRKARREAERAKKTKPSTRPPYSPKPRAVAPVVPTPAPVAPIEPVTRRPLVLTALESSRFRSDHPLVGFVILVDVPFEGSDPDQPDVTAKERPALVVAADGDQALVRPLYSATAPSRRIFSPWRRLGLDHASFVDDARVAVPFVAESRRFGPVTDDEWNALL